MAERTGAESIRQLPTLKLFKIRMDLEMEGGTDALSAAGEAAEPLELDPIDADRGGHRDGPRHAGPDARRPEPYAPAAERLGVPVETVLERLASLQERGGLRRVAAILYHRRAGFSANGMGVWAVPEDRDPRDRQADGRVPRHLALLRAPDLRRLAVLRLHDGPRALEGGVRRDPRLDRRGDRRSTERATLYSSTEFKKVRMLYFTDAFARWEEEHAR